LRVASKGGWAQNIVFAAIFFQRNFGRRRRKAKGSDARRAPAVTKGKPAMALGPGHEQRGQQSRRSVTLETVIPTQRKAGIEDEGGGVGSVVPKNGCHVNRLLNLWPMSEVKKHRPQEEKEEER